MATTTIQYRGTLRLGFHEQGDDILFLSLSGDPLALDINQDIKIHGRYLSVRYWTAEEIVSDNVMIEGAIRTLIGNGDAWFTYSEYTGYLWVEQIITVGGHDLFEELRSHVGRYCLLEIGYSKFLPIPPV
ncbi:MAG: hypothetical protein LC749_12610 [Actinobacteria bacterium]|nr:hypothetical protein [Actinomycetota bacterium]